MASNIDADFPWKENQRLEDVEVMLPKQPHAKNDIWSQRANTELTAPRLIAKSQKLSCLLQCF